jgi:hypothetical protein
MMARLLIHDEDVPAAAREALRAAIDGPAERWTEALESAARVLFAATDLECGEVRDLMGLAGAGPCG